MSKDLIAVDDSLALELEDPRHRSPRIAAEAVPLAPRRVGEGASHPGRFDPGHCFDCARESDLLDHYWKVQREETAFKEAHRWARRAHRHASWALWCSGIGILVAVVAFLTG